MHAKERNVTFCAKYLCFGLWFGGLNRAKKTELFKDCNSESASRFWGTFLALTMGTADKNFKLEKKVVNSFDVLI